MHASASPATRGVFARFVHSEAASSIILLACTVLALVWANSPWHDAYEALAHVTLGVTVGARSFALPVHEWINDGLMALFFFVVGLEIKRELVAGELRDRAPGRAAGRRPRWAGCSCRRRLRRLQRGRPGRARLGHPDGHRHRVRAWASWRCSAPACRSA